MKKIFVSSFLVFLFLVGCMPDPPKTPKVNLNNLIVSSEVIFENSDFYKVEIIIDNRTKYPFILTGVFLQPYKVIVEENRVTQEDIPILIEAKTIRGNKREMICGATIPKTFFKLVPNIKANHLKIDIRGFFINDQGQVINKISGWGGILKL